MRLLLVVLLLWLVPHGFAEEKSANHGWVGLEGKMTSLAGYGNVLAGIKVMRMVSPKFTVGGALYLMVTDRTREFGGGSSSTGYLRSRRSVPLDGLFVSSAGVPLTMVYAGVVAGLVLPHHKKFRLTPELFIGGGRLHLDAADGRTVLILEPQIVEEVNVGSNGGIGLGVSYRATVGKYPHHYTYSDLSNAAAILRFRGNF